MIFPLNAALGGVTVERLSTGDVDDALLEWGDDADMQRIAPLVEDGLRAAPDYHDLAGGYRARTVSRSATRVVVRLRSRERMSGSC